MHHAASLICAASMLWATTAAVAQGQPGSTGGTIGKRDKSISGSATPDERSPSTREHKPHHSAAKSSSCGRIVGRWKWHFDTKTVISSNGSARNSGGYTATWTCNEGQYVFVWSNGATDHILLSTDGNHLDAVNNIGASFSGTRF
jgi:hypothetical protein